MKLHLPKMLTAALFAAVVSLTQASGTTLDDAVLTLESPDITSTVTVSDWSSSQMSVAIELDMDAFASYLNSSWVGGKAQKQTILNVEGTWPTSQTTFNEGWHINGSSGSKYGTPYANAAAPGKSIDPCKVDGVSESLKFTATTLPTYSAISAVLTFGGEELSATWYVQKTDGTTETYYGKKTGIKWGSYNSFTPDGTIKDIYTDVVDYMAVFDTTLNQADSATIAQAVLERPAPGYHGYVWAGTGSSAAWDTTSPNWTVDGQPATYDPASTLTVRFDDTAEAKEVLVNSNIQAGTVEVKDDYTLNIGEEGKFSVTNLRVGSDTTLTLKGQGVYDIGAAASLGRGVELDTDWEGVVRVTNLSTTDQSSPWISNLANDKSWVEFINFTGYDHAWADTFEPGGVTANIILTDDAAHHAAWNMTACAGTMYTMILAGDVQGNGTFKTSGDKSQAIEFRGDISDWTGAFVADASGDRQVVFSNAADDVQASITRLGAGALELVVNNGATFAKAVGVSTTTLNGAATFNADSSLGEVTINNGGGLAVGEDATVNTTSITASGEATSMSGEGTLVLTQAVNLTSGTLTMSGVYDVDAFEYEGARTIEGGEHENNGFATEKGSLTVVNKADDTTLVAGDAIVMRGGHEFSLAADGTAALNSTNYATFYITNQSETVTKAKSKEEDTHVTLASIHVSNGAALDVDQNINLSLVTAEAGGKLNILSGQTVSVGDATTVATIAGEGTYALKGGSKTMTGTLAEGEDWKGTVLLSGVSGTAGNDLNLNTYGHAGSKVELDGFTGYFLKAQVEFAPELVLGEGGLTLNNGYSTLDSGNPKPPTKYTFAGGVSGEGSMTFSKTGNAVTQHLYFTGDVASWTGSLNVTGGFDVFAQYSGENKMVNSLISRTGGDLHVEVGTGDDASVVTFTQGIAASDLSVLAGATAEFQGNVDAGAITVGDGAFATFNDLHITQAITSTGTVTFNKDYSLEVNGFQVQGGAEGYFDVNGEFTTGGNGYKGQQESYLTIVDGGTVIGEMTVTQEGDNYSLSGSGNAMKDDGWVRYDTYYLNDGVLSASALKDETSSVELTGDAVLTVDRDLASVVATGGTINIAGGHAIESISADGTEIQGDVAPAAVQIVENSTANFKDGLAQDNGLHFAAEDGVEVFNMGDEAAYTSGNAFMVVTADTLTFDGGEDVTVGNAVNVTSIVNQSAENATLSCASVISMPDSAVDILALEGNIEIDSSSLHVDDLQINSQREVAVNDLSAGAEGMMTVHGVLTAGEDSVLLANLTLADGSTLNLNGAGDNALTLGSQFGIEEGALVTLDDVTIQTLEGLRIGDSLDLIKALSPDDQLTYLDEAYDGMWFDALFERVTGVKGDYLVYATGESFGLTKVSNVPEPTTGTLSLLALAALAARRRRH